MIAPLDGVRVVDLSQLLPGALATQMLGDLGADVVKVEPPGFGDAARFTVPMVGEQSAFFLLLNRNKRSVTLNLKSEAGCEVLWRLVDQADVFVEGFRPGVLERLGFDAQSVLRRNRRVVYCSITGYGQSGPWKDRAGHDLNYQALAGLVSLGAGPDGAPAVPGGQIADVAGGSWPAVSGILAALLARERTGEGQVVDVAMTDGATSLMPIALGEAADGVPFRGPGRGMITGALPSYGIYRCSDDRHITLGILEPKFWSSFVHAVGHPEWEARQMGSPDEMEGMRADLAVLFAERTRDEWMEVLSDPALCVAPVLSPQEVAGHAYHEERGNFPWVDHPTAGRVRSLATPIRLSAAPPPPERPSPALGEHTEAVARELGYGDDDLVALRERGAW